MVYIYIYIYMVFIKIDCKSAQCSPDLVRGISN